MVLSREQKTNILSDLVEKLKKAKAAFLVDFTKLSVSRAMDLRRSLKQVDAEYKVAKKTLINRALRQENYQGFDLENFKTQVGVIFSYGEPVPSAQMAYKFSKANEFFKILGGFLGLEWKNKSQIITLAQLPSREVLLAHLARTLASPLSGLARVLSGNMRNLVNILNNLKVKKG